MGRFSNALAKTFASVNVRVYRASGGKVMGKVQGVPLLLLTVTGRKTGARRTNPVCYVEDADRFLVAGSAGGARSEPQWFRNLRASEQAEIEVGRRKLVVSVSVAEGEEHARLWQRFVSAAPFFGNYQDKAERQIPVAVLTPAG